MFDYYEPLPPLHCSVCGQLLDGWQGKDGDCALFYWQQDIIAPVGQDGEEVSWSKKELQQFHLKDGIFTIYTDSCNCPFLVEAIGTVEGGIWIKTELVTEHNSRQRNWKKSEYAARLKWLRSGSKSENTG